MEETQDGIPKLGTTTFFGGVNYGLPTYGLWYGGYISLGLEG
jgi:hypothetical protein